MTTILAIQGDGWAVIGSDTQWTDDEGRVGKSNQPKVATVGRYLIGIAGDVRGCNVVQHVFTPPTLPPKSQGAKLTKFIVSQFVPAYRQILESNGVGLPQYDSEIARTTIDSLVVANGVVFQIDGDYGTEMDANRIYAIGSGGCYGIAALQALTEKKKLNVATARQAVLKALAIAAKFDSGTGGPFHVFSQGVA